MAERDRCAARLAGRPRAADRSAGGAGDARRAAGCRWSRSQAPVYRRGRRSLAGRQPHSRRTRRSGRSDLGAAAGAAGRADGTLVVTAPTHAQGSPAIGARLRTVLGGASRALYGTRAPLVDALMLGRRGGIDPELQDRFAQSGLVHLLSISGFHVGLIGGVGVPGRAPGRARRERGADRRGDGEHGLRRLPRLAGAGDAGRGAGGRPGALPRAPAARSRARSCLRPPASRCCWSIPGPCSTSAAGCPRRHSGARRASAAGPTRLGAGFGWRTLGSSVGATLATAPITAWALGTVAPVGIALNFAAIPIAAVAVPGVLASLLLYPVVAPPRAAVRGRRRLDAAPARARRPAGRRRARRAPAARGRRRRRRLPWVLALGLGLWSRRRARPCPRRRAGPGGRSPAAVGCARSAPVVGAADGDWGPRRYIFSTSGRGTRRPSGPPPATGCWWMPGPRAKGPTLAAGRRAVSSAPRARGRSPSPSSPTPTPTIWAACPPCIARLRGGTGGRARRATSPIRGTPGFSIGCGRRHAVASRAYGRAFALDGVRFTVLHPTPGWPSGTRTSTRTRSCCWWSTAISRRCSRATRAFPRNRPWRGGFGGWIC